MDIKKSILKWYNRHSNFLDAMFDIASELVPGGKIITNILKVFKGIFDDKQDFINEQVSEEQIREITNFLGVIRPKIIDLMEDIEELKEFQDSISEQERRKILEEGSFKEEVKKIIPDITAPLTETVNRTKSTKNLLNDRYLKLNTLGQGGQGTVYKCIDTKTDLVVALKILPHKMGSDGYELLKKEYHRLIKRLSHRNIVQYRGIDIDIKTQDSFLIMDYLEGRTLRSLMIKKMLSTDQVFSLEETISLLTGIAKALDYAHNNNVLHLDLKPENILVDHNKESYLFDFGLSQDIQHTILTSGANQNTTSKGTLAYMSPEQYKGKKTGIQTDIWALGVIIYEMLSGIHPFNGRTFEHFYKLVCDEEIEEIENVSDAINKILKKCLKKKRKDRLKSAIEILKELETKKDIASQDTKENIEKLSAKTKLKDTHTKREGLKHKLGDKSSNKKDIASQDTKENIEQPSATTKLKDTHTKREGLKYKLGDKSSNKKELPNVESDDLQKNKKKTKKEDNKKVVQDEENTGISIEIPEIEGDFYKIKGDKKNIIDTKSIELDKNEYLGIKIVTSEGFKKVINLSDSILDKIKDFDLSGYKDVTNKEIGDLSVLKNLQILDLSECKQISDKGIQTISKLKELRNLNLGFCEAISDNDIKTISKLKKLQSLNLINCRKITDNGIKHLLNLRDLKVLNIGVCYQITDNAVSYMIKLKHLKTLSLWGCYQISDKGLEFIYKLQALKYLDLTHCSQISDKGLEFIAKLKNLQMLYLKRCYKISDTGLQYIAQLQHLQSLDLSSCEKISDTGLQYIAQLQHLQSLDLSSCEKISDTGLQYIAQLQHLQTLDLRNCIKIEESEIKKLQLQSNSLSIIR